MFVLNNLKKKLSSFESFLLYSTSTSEGRNELCSLFQSMAPKYIDCRYEGRLPQQRKPSYFRLTAYMSREILNKKSRLALCAHVIVVSFPTEYFDSEVGRAWTRVIM